MAQSDGETLPRVLLAADHALQAVAGLTEILELDSGGGASVLRDELATGLALEQLEGFAVVDRVAVEHGEQQVLVLDPHREPPLHVRAGRRVVRPGSPC